MLGGGAFYSGISFDTHKCGAPLKVLFPNATAAQLRLIQDKFIRELSAAMSKVVGKVRLGMRAGWPCQVVQARPSRALTAHSFARAQEVRPTSSFATEVHKGGGSWEDAWAGMAEHPRTEEWRQALTVTMSRYLFTKPFGSTAVRSVLTCPTAPTSCVTLLTSSFRRVGQQSLHTRATPHRGVCALVTDIALQTPLSRTWGSPFAPSCPRPRCCGRWGTTPRRTTTWRASSRT